MSLHGRRAAARAQAAASGWPASHRRQVPAGMRVGPWATGEPLPPREARSPAGKDAGRRAPRAAMGRPVAAAAQGDRREGAWGAATAAPGESKIGDEFCW